MKTIEYPSPILFYNLEELAEICKITRAAVSTVICSTDKVVVFYRNLQTKGVQDADFVDELHIRHKKCPSANCGISRMKFHVTVTSTVGF